MEPFPHHIFVCTQPKPEGVTNCPANGAWSVLAALERELLAQGLDNDVQLSTCGCLGLCDEGPILIVYPEGIWYRKVREADVPEIVSGHLRNGKIVDRLAWTDAAAMKAMSTEHRDHFRAMLKAREQAGILPDDLNETIRGFMPSRAILTALELDIFSAVGGGATIERVAQKIHADSRSTEMLLNVLVSLHLLDKCGDTFRNTPTAARFFVEGSPDNARTALLHTANLWDRWSTLTDAVRSGTSVAARTRDQRGVVSFIAAMDRNAKERADTVVRAVTPNGVRRMLDLGGGSGAYSIAFAEANPDLHSEVMDLAEVIPITQGHIRHAGLTDRISTRVGDMLHDPLGERYDLVLLSAICHMFSVEENRALFERVYRALVPGGRFVVQDFILEPDKTSPRFATLFALNMLVGTRAGSTYSEPEYASWLHDAGFDEFRRVHLPGPAHLMLATRP
ncbi:MAG TPA: methyltransferase [Candidatus Sulfotelmatobacter sp.]|nr:methyltransferase [Candidatus Sulfotelmatobacter sp.]